MKTLAKVFLSFSPKLKLSLLAIVCIVAILLYNTTSVSVVHAEAEREQQRKLDEIQSLSDERKELDVVYLKNEEEIERLKKENV